MKAIVRGREGTAGFLELREMEKPSVGDDAVLLRVVAASVNAADWHLSGGLPRLFRTMMRSSNGVSGFDVAGQVETIGRNVTRFKPGDQVFGVSAGSFAEYTTAAENRLAPMPHNLTLEQAAAIPFAGCTALQGLRDKGHVGAGRSVLIYGAGGGVGTLAVQIARALGAHVTAVTSTANLDLLRSLGAHEVIDYTREDFVARGERYDVLFDIGANRSLADCRRALAPGGTMVLVGAPKGFPAIVSRQIKARLFSRRGGRRIAPFLARGRLEDLIALKDLAEAGKLKPVIDRRYPLSETADAVRYMGTGQARGKVIIKVT